MLSNTSTLYLVNLCDKYPENKYVIVEWEDLAKINTNEDENFDIAEVWNELKMNGCLINKYKDDSEVCFTLTDKSRVLVQEYKILVEQMAKQSDEENAEAAPLSESYIKTDNNGSLVLMPTGGDVAKKRKFELKKMKKTAVGRGFLGGLISGGICGLLFGLIGGFIANLIL
ncbi:MAG: hypothetical protein K2G37_01885 [Clostridia bacterium]|nr:hypothetical protein [Clostridia bacterium]MDE7328352.1 hypothetical protein [Clostridia bacterium]